MTQRKRVRLDHEERRGQILAAAARLFLQRPYSEVSITDIADEVGVARGLLHHYFDSKRDLYLETVRDVARVPRLPVPDDPGSADGADDTTWERAVDGFLDLVEANRRPYLAALQVGAAGRDDEVAAIVDDAAEVMAEQTMRAVGIDPDLAPPEVRALVRGFGGFFREVSLEWLVRGRLDRDQTRAALVETLTLLLDGVLPSLVGQRPTVG